MLWIPMGGLLAVTLTALTIVISRNVNLIFTGGFDVGQHLLQLLFGILLLALGIMVAVQGVKKLSEKDSGAAQAA